MRRITSPVIVMMAACITTLSASHITLAQEATNAPPIRAGRVIFTTNNLSAKSDDGSARTLRRGSSIYAGDTLITGVGGITQVRMLDGGLLALRKNTTFKIEEFAYQTPEDRSFFALLRGGFRTITGKLGKKDKNNYQVRTPVATIGIRGTHYGLRLCVEQDCADEGIDKDGLYGGVVDGAIGTQNTSGAHEFGNDEYFYVADQNARAESLLAPPGVVFGSDLPIEIGDASLGDDADELRSLHPEALELANTLATTTSAGIVALGQEFNPELPNNLDDLVQASLPNDGAIAAVAYLADEATGIYPYVQTVLADDNNQIILNNAGTAVTGTLTEAAAACPNCSFTAPDGTVLEDLGADASLGVVWGRWGAGWQAQHNGIAQDPTGGSWAHFIYANNITQAVNYPTGSITYDNIIASTSPTNQDGQLGTVVSASIAIDFGVQEVSSYNLQLSFSGSGENINVSNLGGGTTFSNAAAGGIILDGQCNGGQCNNTLIQGNASVHLLGDHAETAASAYSLREAGQDEATLGYSGVIIVSE